MTPAIVALTVIATAQTPPEEAQAAPQVYTFSASTGRLAALVYESSATESSGRSHHHVVLATRWSGRMRWDLEEGCAGEFVVQVSGLSADDPAEREREGFETRLADRDRKAVNEHLRHRDQLFADQFPTIKYNVTGCARDDSDHVVIQGDFTLRGITQPVALRVVATESADVLHLEGQGSITHTIFGFEPYYALFGQRQNQDRMQLVINVDGKSLGSDAGLKAPLMEGPRSR